MDMLGASVGAGTITAIFRNAIALGGILTVFLALRVCLLAVSDIRVESNLSLFLFFLALTSIEALSAVLVVSFISSGSI